MIVVFDRNEDYEDKNEETIPCDACGLRPSDREIHMGKLGTTPKTLFLCHECWNNLRRMKS